MLIALSLQCACSPLRYGVPCCFVACGALLKPGSRGKHQGERLFGEARFRSVPGSSPGNYFALRTSQVEFLSSIDAVDMMLTTW